MKILNFGSANIDHVYRTDKFVLSGETKQCTAYSRNSGGKGLNQSVALAKAGAEVFHAGLLGSDAGFLREILEQSGVDCRFLKTVDAPSGHAMIEVEQSGQNRIVLFPGTNCMLTETFADEVLANFEAGDILLLQNETNLIPYLMRSAAEKGMQIAFNAAPVTEHIKDYPLQLVRWLFVNETEGAVLSGAEDPAIIGEKLGIRYPGMEVILTLGSDGALLCRNGECQYCPARQVYAVDTTGAGDTFTGFFLAAVAAGKTAKESLELASAAAAIAVTRPGAAASVPLLSEVKAFL